MTVLSLACAKQGGTASVLSPLEFSGGDFLFAEHGHDGFPRGEAGSVRGTSR